MSITSNNNTIAKNTFYLYIRMFFVLIVSLYTSRVILNTLGVEDFGIFNVVSGFVSLFGFFNATLSASMQRFYNFELGKQGELGIQRVYSTGFYIHVFISVVLVALLETIGIWYINSIMIIPEQRLFVANLVYQSVVFSMILIIMQTPYLGIILAYEKMGIYAFVSIFDIILKLFIVIALPHLPFDKLLSYSVLLSGVSIINFVLYYFYANKLVTDLKLNRRDTSLFKSILSFSGWNLLGTFAFMIKDQGLNMILNVFFGPLINAARGVAFQVKGAVSNFTQSITTSFRPQIVDAYAKDNQQRVNSLFFFESRVCFSLILLLINPLIIEIELILRVWLGDTVPDNSGLFTSLVLLDSLICSINPSVGHVAHAVGSIKNYQIRNSIVNISILPIAWLVLYLGGSPASAFVCSILFSILNQLVCLVELNRIYNYRIGSYFRLVLCPCVFAAVLSFTLQWPSMYFMDNGSIARFIIVCVNDIVFTGALIYFLIFNKSERCSIKEMILKKLFIKRTA